MISCAEKYGCTPQQLKELRRIGREMRRAGKGRITTPICAFTQQRLNAKRRCVEWKISLWQWWTIWQESGKWDDRGRGHGYVMCRHGDIGPYEVGNVFIATNGDNTAQQKSNRDLPRGVYKRGRRYRAERSIDGKSIHLGTFNNPEQAHAAYLSAGSGRSDAGITSERPSSL